MRFSYPYTRPYLRPVIPLGERLRRRLAFADAENPASHLSSFAIRRFHPHVSGLESFGGRGVLEIGGSREISTKPFFSGIGSSYRNVRLERNIERDPCVIVGDFMDVDGASELVISLGVFEIGAIDVDFERMEAGIIRHGAVERAEKLSSLTRPGGYCVIGTISSPCFFSDRSLAAAGFEIIHRESPFYSFMNTDSGDVYDPQDRSELLILKKQANGKE